MSIHMTASQGVGLRWNLGKLGQLDRPVVGLGGVLNTIARFSTVQCV